ncbi:putative peroxisome biosynthesis protein [Diaporthe ampelina]|uniref:Peroxisomal ATPase PEX1 n=1 Tax=Diaporthe ampelina TaxID=1214573 RepID=A0A0G2FGW2_9PEZI|nr:putative peroxisome biosynthesis protein [Diaporthe ampelina]
MSQRKATAAEISLVHLKNCLVNLPASLVSLLVTVNTPVQNVIVELSYRDASPADKSPAPSAQKSVYLGWTGMPSKKKIASIVGRDGLGGSGLHEQDVPLVELDPTLAITLGLHEGQKVMTTIHTDPPLAHTVNIEPLTPDDWEIIELHATFLELNLLSQIRALPNPAYSPPSGIKSSPHPLTLHLSPTSTANIKILSLEPAQSAQTAFAKIAPDAEVIVAPKREERKPALFLRGVDRKLCDDWFDDESGAEELSIWVDRELLVSNEFRRLKWVTVHLMRPSALQEPAPMQGQQPQAQEAPELSRSGLRVVAQLLPWDDPPNGQTAALSTILCSAFGSEGLVGGVVKVEPAAQPLTKKSILKSVAEVEDRPSVQQLKVYPFTSDSAAQALGLKFGGETKAEREEAAKRVKQIYDGKHGKSLWGARLGGKALVILDDLDRLCPVETELQVGNENGRSRQPDLDLLDIAGETDGYMPGDLNLLISRARNEAIMRSLTKTTSDSEVNAVPLGRVDFENALKGFTPASLRNVTLQSSTTTFESIGGLTETRQVLLETLQYPTKYAPIFAQCPLRLRSGILLYGYPGCGKTLLASAVAGECGLNFISVKGPEILNKYIGASEKSVRDLFERAQAAKPCVLFFDEFDSIAPKRGHDSTGVTDRVVNQLLTLMDGAEGLSGVYVLAATSRPDLIDPALLRPGRLDKSILCDFPNPEERVDIIRAIGKKAKLSEAVLKSDEDLIGIARRTDGFSGADLQALISNAQLEAIQDVLKDPEIAGGGGGSGRRPGQRHGLAKSAGSLPHSFVQFRYGEDGSSEDSAPRGSNRSSELAEQAMIVSKLERLKASRKRAKQQRSGPNTNAESDAAPGSAKAGGDAQEKEVIIQWRHLVKALDGTRTSIGREQRTLLQRIYREFVVGRSGEMRDGQGSMEVGGRSSLM